ncbi:acyloxyacyl hydrolase [Agarivorans sp. MS3-6]
MFRYTISVSEKRQWFFQVGAGPSVMSSVQLGNQVQGSRFLFNDWIGVGVKFGEEKDWELNMSWRHLSNANLTPPNPGFDVPLTFTLGHKF